MAELSGNFYNILRDWAKEKIQKSLVDAFTGTRSRKKKKAVSFLGNASNISLKGPTNKMLMTLICSNNSQYQNNRSHRLMTGMKYQNIAI